MKLRQVNSDRAADSLVDAIRNQILSGHYRPGETLPSERDLMGEFSASRTVIREALQRLSATGFLVTKPRHRPVVTLPAVEGVFGMLQSSADFFMRQDGGVRHLFETRILVESSLVRSAAKHASSHDLKRLKTALEINESHISNSPKFYESDMAFHRVLYEISNNPVLSALHVAYVEWLSPHWISMPSGIDRNQRNFQSHKAIFDGILLRDPNLAEDELIAHLEYAWEQVGPTIAHSGNSGDPCEN